MAIRAIRVALLLASLPIAGCGTIVNLSRSYPSEGGKVPFGGVKQDVACFKNAENGEFGFRKHPGSESEKYPQVTGMVLCAADMPFSLIGDILTWPYTASYTYINEPVPLPPVIPSPTPPAIQPTAATGPSLSP